MLKWAKRKDKTQTFSKNVQCATSAGTSEYWSRNMSAKSNVAPTTSKKILVEQDIEAYLAIHERKHALVLM